MTGIPVVLVGGLRKQGLAESRVKVRTAHLNENRALEKVRNAHPAWERTQ
jgi:hypothetical protein